MKWHIEEDFYAKGRHYQVLAAKYKGVLLIDRRREPFYEGLHRIVKLVKLVYEEPYLSSISCDLQIKMGDPLAKKHNGEIWAFYCEEGYGCPVFQCEEDAMEYVDDYNKGRGISRRKK